MGIDDLLNKLDEAERSFEGTEFLAPIIGSNRIQIRIAGIVCRLTITKNLPERFFGWAILRAKSTNKATFLREASMTEISAYVRLFPVVRLILLQKIRENWLAMPAHRGDSRFQIRGPVALRLPEEGLQRFETVLSGFDGHLFWYKANDPGRNPALAAYLREQIIQQDEKGMPPPPAALNKSGLSAEERETYALAWAMIFEEKRDKIEVRLSEALAHAGAELRDYNERGDNYVVRYVVDGRVHVTTVSRDDLSVMTAGICLAGRDRHFDLTSMVGVLREAGQHNMIWVGGRNLPEDDYWRIHPPDNP